ncbi:MAG: hypothetical protein ACRENB_05265 [Gemmatimonadales bacterium]
MSGRGARWLLVALLGLATVWLLLRSYVPAASRECLAMYRSARTAGDTVRIDSTVPDAGRSQADPHSCGFMRHSARWQ